MRGLHSRSTLLFASTLVLAMSCGGCREKDPGFEIMTLDGKVDKLEINADGTGSVTVVYYSEKHKREIAGTGIVTKETEIMINGALGKLSDIREGDRVRGEVRIEKKKGVRRQIAVKIIVDRAEPIGGTN